MSFRLEQQRHLGRLEDTDKPSTLNVIAKVRPHPTKPTHTGHANPGAQPHKVVPGIPDKHGAKEMSDERLSTSNYGPRASGMCGGSSNLDQQQSERPPAEGRNHQHMHLCHQMGTQFTVRIGGAEVCHTDDIKRVETENCSASRKKYADCFPPHTVIERKIWTNEPYINLRAEKSLTDKRSTQMEPGFINTLTPQPESEQGGAKEQKQYTTPASTVKGRVEHELSPESAVSRQQGSRNGAYRGPVSYSGQPITEQNRKAGVSGGYSSMFNVPSGQNQWQQQPNPPPYYSLQYEHQGSNTGDAAQSTNSKGGNSNAYPHGHWGANVNQYNAITTGQGPKGGSPVHSTSSQVMEVTRVQQRWPSWSGQRAPVTTNCGVPISPPQQHNAHRFSQQSVSTFYQQGPPSEFSSYASTGPPSRHTIAPSIGNSSFCLEESTHLPCTSDPRLQHQNRLLMQDPSVPRSLLLRHTGGNKRSANPHPSTNVSGYYPENRGTYGHASVYHNSHFGSGSIPSEMAPNSTPVGCASRGYETQSTSPMLSAWEGRGGEATSYWGASYAFGNEPPPFSHGYPVQSR